MAIREYGSSGPWIVLLHGGPGAPGYMAPVARGLAGSFRVLEPFQRRSGDTPLSVARHIDDLHQVVIRCGDKQPALVGHSWGAMLALAYAAAHPNSARALVLVGCGTFDQASRDRVRETREARLDNALGRRLEHLAVESPDPDQRLAALGSMMLPLDSCELIDGALELGTCDARAYQETWDDMLRLQTQGVYPASFAAITQPVLMLHGAADPHPGPMIRASLMASLPQLEYREWERCGHYPWLERAVRDDFFAVLRQWLSDQRLPDR